MHTLVAKYEDDPPGVVFTFFASGEKLWGWVHKDRLEALAGRPLSIHGCMETYQAYKELIQQDVLRKKSRQEAPRESLIRKLIRGVSVFGRGHSTMSSNYKRDFFID